jgi:hypothetical protein
VLLAGLLLIERHQRRYWSHEYDQLIARHHNLRDAHEALKAKHANEGLSADDYELLSDIAAELAGALVAVDGDPLLSDAEAVNAATIPVPVVEIEYPDRLVTLRLEVEHYDAEEVHA